LSTQDGILVLVARPIGAQSNDTFLQRRAKSLSTQDGILVLVARPIGAQSNDTFL
jgi:hypothetical protein